MTFVCQDCETRVFVTRTDYVSDGSCTKCGGVLIVGSDDTVQIYECGEYATLNGGDNSA